MIHNSRFKIALILIIIFALAGGYFILRKPASVSASWWDNDWQYRKKITIDRTKIDENLKDFPVLVKLTSSQLDFTKVQSAGQDIRFVDAYGNSLSYEIEDWTQASSTADVWVKIPQIASKTDTYFYMYYGNPAAADAQNKTSVWDSNYKMVQHMNSTSWLDSTSNAVNGTAYGDATTTTSGQIGTAGTFDGTGDYLQMSSDPLRNKPQVTVSMWVKASSATISGTEQFIVDTPGGGYLAMFLARATGGGYNNFLLGMDSGSNSDVFSTTLANTTNWYYVSGVYDGSYERLYINGIQEGTPKARTGNTYSYTPPQPLYINSNNSSGDFPGIIDEVRISNKARSAAWIKADYNSQNNTLLTFNKEETGTGPVVWYKFDEGQGTTAYDSSNNSGTRYNGTISGAAWTDLGKYEKALIFDGTNDVVTVRRYKTNKRKVPFLLGKAGIHSSHGRTHRLKWNSIC